MIIEILIIFLIMNSLNKTIFFDLFWYFKIYRESSIYKIDFLKFFICLWNEERENGWKMRNWWGKKKGLID